MQRAQIGASGGQEGMPTDAMVGFLTKRSQAAADSQAETLINE
jgi:hypothetical protein